MITGRRKPTRNWPNNQDSCRTCRNLAQRQPRPWSARRVDDVSPTRTWWSATGFVRASTSGTARSRLEFWRIAAWSRASCRSSLSRITPRGTSNRLASRNFARSLDTYFFIAWTDWRASATCSRTSRWSEGTSCWPITRSWCTRCRIYKR